MCTHVCVCLRMCEYVCVCCVCVRMRAYVCVCMRMCAYVCVCVFWNLWKLGMLKLRCPFLFLVSKLILCIRVFERLTRLKCCSFKLLAAWGVVAVVFGSPKKRCVRFANLYGVNITRLNQTQIDGPNTLMNMGYKLLVKLLCAPSKASINDFTDSVCTGYQVDPTRAK